MPPSTLGAAAAVLALLLWWLRRRRPVVVLSSTDASAVAALNRSQLVAAALGPDPVADPAAGAMAPAAPETAVSPLPASLGQRQRTVLLAGLRQQLAGDGPSRLEAMRMARRWGDPAVLPLLHRGLRDPDLAVVREAALGLERFRGRCPGLADAQPTTPVTAPLPRNVSRTL
ncbi:MULTISPECIES: HEAT repeat domain-containing protein [Aphanothece]|uniref:HEAT repeat domain-containing protein n=1 Tax=Aphanothece TaxID=1121 RepID=UPI003984CC7F